MAGTATETPRLTDEPLAELLHLSRNADSVELKLTLPEANNDRPKTALEFFSKELEAGETE